MPSASVKTETRPTSEGQDAIKIALNVVEKKVRNLEKRKGKLDAYREKSEKGDTLDKDQQEAVQKYETVIQNLEFARELERQFKSINADAEKLLKKQAKREKIEKTAQEVKRMQELLQLQDVLNSMGSEDVRNDFMNGKHGAVTLSEENLNQLDELYKLVSPTREGETSYEEQLSAASEHLVNLLDSKDKTVLGSTYKALRELISKISECGYFDNVDSATEQKEPPVKADVDIDIESSASEEYVTANTGDNTDTQSTETPMSNEGPSDDLSGQTSLQTDNQQSTLVDQSFFSQQTHQQQQAVPSPFEAKRDFKEIVSSVQGNYNFLQESEIEDTPHMDPAVLAAHPMVPPIPHPSDLSNGLTSQQYTAALLSEQAQNEHQQTVAQSWHSQVQAQEANQAWGSQTYTSSINSTSNYGQESTPDVPPPAIPLPDQTDDSQNKPQKFAMNVDAAVFQSMITQSSHDSTEDTQQTEQSQDIDSSSGFGGSWNARGNSWNTRGGPSGRGRGGRGGGTGNGFNRGGRGGERGGYSNRGYNNRGSSRPYQGFPPRDNYRPDSYQGLNGNSMSSGGFNKPRGGGMRGGGPRGNSRGSGPRGRGGFDNRQNFSNSQQSTTA